MADILNLEGNLKFSICLVVNNMLDYESERSDSENWMPFTLRLNLPHRCSEIAENAKATMTIFEVKHLIKGIESVLSHLKLGEKRTYIFNSSESFFDLRVEAIPEDYVIEIELWVNVGNQTKGKISGYDEGVRFVVAAKTLDEFLKEFKSNFSEIMNHVLLVDNNSN